jgi:hypothetical protein
MTARLLLGAVLAAALLGGPVPADGPLKSGPPVGAKNNRSGFFPEFVTGPGKPRCPV